MGTGVLTLLGHRPYQALQHSNNFRDHNIKSIHELRAQRNDQRKLVSTAKQARDDLAQFFEREESRLAKRHEGWDQET
jgi:glutathione-regulated potassium-efflux system ancillary protein KefC